MSLLNYMFVDLHGLPCPLTLFTLLSVLGITIVFNVKGLIFPEFRLIFKRAVPSAPLLNPSSGSSVPQVSGTGIFGHTYVNSLLWENLSKVLIPALALEGG